MKNEWFFYNKRNSNFLNQCSNHYLWYMPYKLIIWQGQKAMEACSAQGNNNKLMVYRIKHSLLSLLSSTLVYHLLVSHPSLRVGMSSYLSPGCWVHPPMQCWSILSHSLMKSPPSFIARGKECLIVWKRKVQVLGNWGNFTSYQLCPCPEDNLSLCWLTRDVSKNSPDLLQITVFITFVSVCCLTIMGWIGANEQHSE